MARRYLDALNATPPPLCPTAGCRGKLRGDRPFCRRCFRRLPHFERLEIRRTDRHTPTAAQLRAHFDALTAALEWLENA